MSRQRRAQGRGEKKRVRERWVYVRKIANIENINL